MKILLLNVNYTDNTDRFWFDSCVKNKKIEFNPDTENIHEVIKTLCEDQDGMEFTYKGKPQRNVYRDVLDSKGKIKGYETIGYMYRGKADIYNTDKAGYETGYFDVWVTISEIVPFSIDEMK